MEADAKRLVDVEVMDDVTVATFVASNLFDEKNLQIIGDRLLALIDEEDCRKLILDLSNVKYFSSAALDILVATHNRMQEVNGDLRICNIRHDVYEVFAITKLTELFRFYENQEKAFEGL